MFYLPSFRALLLLGTAVSQIISGVLSAPAPSVTDPLGRRACSTIRVRKEWRDLTVAEQLDYLRAVKCLMTLPATVTGRAAVVNRFDEFQSTHVDLASVTHGVGQFLVWHRHHMTLYANALREECNYQGPAAYWDWTRDADGAGVKASPIFDPVTGFGGDGVPSNGSCVDTGPFADMIVRFGPGVVAKDHCLTRTINEDYTRYLTSDMVKELLKETTFERFRTMLEGGGGSLGIGIHTSGHSSVGGELANPISSPGDPLFYLHHGNLDRVWWHWQKADPENRLYAISGRSSFWPPFTNVTLDTVLTFTSLTDPVTVRDLMNIEAEPGCFTYND